MFRKHSVWLQEKFKERVSLFMDDIYNPLLNNHSLDGKWRGYRSINVTGDIRAVFEEININHSEAILGGKASKLQVSFGYCFALDKTAT